MPTFVLPGFTGSVLSTAGGDVFSASRAAMHFPIQELQKRTPEEWVPLLSTEHAVGAHTPIRTSLTDGVHIFASREIKLAYERMREAGYTIWHYDWRLDTRHLAAALIADLRAAGLPCDVVAHSYGCLVVATAAAMAGAAMDTLLRRVVLIGPPLAGTMEAAFPLLFGPRDLYKKYRLHLRRACRHWPALYQMLPNRDWPCVVDEYQNHCPSNLQLLLASGWVEPREIPNATLTDMLERATEAQQILHDGIRGLVNRGRILVLFGKGHSTDTTVERRGDVMREESKPDKGIVAGDGLVPLHITRDQWCDGVLRAVSQEIAGERHAFMCEDDLVLSRTIKFLSN